VLQFVQLFTYRSSRLRNHSGSDDQRFRECNDCAEFAEEELHPLLRIDTPKRGVPTRTLVPDYRRVQLGLGQRSLNSVFQELADRMGKLRKAPSGQSHDRVDPDATKSQLMLAVVAANDEIVVDERAASLQLSIKFVSRNRGHGNFRAIMA
jgi:hypothetical protein